MASTIVLVELESGLSSPVVKLAAIGAPDTLVNGAGGDTLTEQSNMLGFYSATVTEALSGWYLASLETSGGELKGTGRVYLEDDTNTYIVNDTVNSSGQTYGMAGTINTLDALDTAQDTQHSTTQTAVGNCSTHSAAAVVTAMGTGTFLTGIPWNSNWDAEVQSEVNDGLVALGLDHLVSAAVAGSDVTDDSIFAKLVSRNATADWDDYDNTNESLQGNRLNNSIAHSLITSNQTAISSAVATVDIVVDAIQVVTDRLDDTMEDDGGTYRFTTNALEQGPSGGGGGGGLTALASGTAQSGTSTTIQLAAASTFSDDELNGNVVKITGGTGAGQARPIFDYTGSTDTATVTPAWTTTPDNTSVYEVVEGSVNTVLIEGVDATDQIAAAVAVGANPQLLVSTTIATLATQESFTLTTGSADDDAYNGALAVITDASTSTQKAFGWVSDYTGATKTVTLLDDPGVFTMAAGDTINIIAIYGLATPIPTTATGGTVAAKDRRILDNLIKPTPAVAGQLPGEPSTLILDRHNDWSEQLTLDTDITGWAKIWLTCKPLVEFSDDDDAADAIFQLKAVASPASDGLIYLNGAAATLSEGSVTVDNTANGQVTFTLTDATVTAISAGDYEYNVKWENGSGVIRPLTATGKVKVRHSATADIT